MWGPFPTAQERFSGESPGSIKVLVVTARLFCSFGFLKSFKGVVGGAGGWGWTEMRGGRVGCCGRMVKRGRGGKAEIGWVGDGMC